MWNINVTDAQAGLFTTVASIMVRSPGADHKERSHSNNHRPYNRHSLVSRMSWFTFSNAVLTFRNAKNVTCRCRWKTSESQGLTLSWNLIVALAVGFRIINIATAAAQLYFLKYRYLEKNRNVSDGLIVFFCYPSPFQASWSIARFWLSCRHPLDNEELHSCTTNGSS